MVGMAGLCWIEGWCLRLTYLRGLSWEGRGLWYEEGFWSGVAILRLGFQGYSACVVWRVSKGRSRD